MIHSLILKSTEHITILLIFDMRYAIIVTQSDFATTIIQYIGHTFNKLIADIYGLIA